MSINLRGFDILVAKLLLHGANVGTRLKQMGGEGMPQGVAGDVLFDSGLLRSHLDRPIDIRLVDMMTSQQTGTWFKRKSRRREKILPTQGFVRIPVLARQSIGHPDASVSRTLTILPEMHADTFNLDFQQGRQFGCQGRETMMMPLSIPDLQLLMMVQNVPSPFAQNVVHQYVHHHQKVFPELEEFVLAC